MSRICISTECVADLPQELLAKYDISVIHYDIQTDKGIFRDKVEIDDAGIIEYMIQEKKPAKSIVPSANDYKNFFQKRLEEYEEIIHVCISSGISEALENATLSRAKLGIDGKRIHLIDSRLLSSGQGLLVLEVAKWRDQGLPAREIVDRASKLVSRISTTFIAYNVDYLFYNGKVSEKVKKICDTFKLHPVLGIIDGKMTVVKLYFGNYGKAIEHYIKYILKNPERINKHRGFVTYAGCEGRLVESVKARANYVVAFEELYEQTASATVSCNCGPNTIGILYIRDEEKV